MIPYHETRSVSSRLRPCNQRTCHSSAAFSSANYANLLNSYLYCDYTELDFGYKVYWTRPNLLGLRIRLCLFNEDERIL